MTTIFAGAGMAALVALGAVFTAIPAASAAQSGVALHDLRHDRHRLRVCSPLEAVRKARERGMRNAHIAEIAPHRVVVEGRGRHGRDRVVFANLPDCAVVRR
jgi:hypothetical protein